MEETSDTEYNASLSRRLEILRQLNAQGQYATHVFVTNVEYDGVDKQIYLPDMARRIIRASLEDPKYTSFAVVWQAFAHYGYSNYMDGSQLDILTLATAWLAVGIDVANRKIKFINEETQKVINEIPQPFYALSLATDVTERNAELFKIIDTEINAAIQLEYSTNLAFTRVNIINAAIQFFPSIITGLKSQAKLEKTFSKIVNDYQKITPLPAFDDMLENGSFVLELIGEDGRTVELAPGSHIDLFDRIACSPIVPVCIFNGDEVKTGKAIFQSVNNRIIKTDCPSAESLLLMQKREFFSNARSLRIVMLVFIGDDIEKAADLVAEDFVEVIFSFKKGDAGYNKFTVTFKYEEAVDILIERLNIHIKDYQVAMPDKVQNRMVGVTQTFVIPALALDKEVFMFFTTTDVANSLFRFDEHDTPWSQKKILSFAILLVGHVKMIVKAEVVDHTTFPVIDKGKLAILVKGDHIVTITLSAQNMEQYNLARYVILRFFANYVRNYEANYNIYNQMFPRKRIAPIVPVAVMTGDEAQGGNGLRNIKHLRVVDPALWTRCNYTRVAASNVDQQVKPINKSEVDKYIRSGRMVIKWPVEVRGLPADKQTRPSIDPRTGKEIRVFYTAFSSKNPFIALVPNMGPNADDHPYIPKCQKTPSTLIVNADWSLSIVEKEKNTTRSNKKTLRLLSPGETGPVYGSLNHYIGNGNSVYRYGVLRSKASFLHCVMFATSQPDDEYRNVHTSKAGEDLIVEMRHMLSAFASVCMQENPGKTVEEIASAIENPDVYLDPTLYYRACEEMYGVNIFVAGPNDSKELLLQAPNFENFYIRTKRRPLSGSMVVIKLPLPHTEGLNMFQCEVLFITQGEGGSLFTDEVTRKLEEATNKIAKSIKITPTCVIKTLPDGKVAATQVMAVEESTPDVQLPASFLSKLTAMHVDPHGKCRGIRVKLPNGTQVWIITPPIEPLCGPNVGDVEENSTFKEVENGLEIAEVEALEANKRAYVISELFSTAEFHFTPQDGQLVGMWFDLYGLNVYLPLEPSPWLETYTPVKYSIVFNSITTESPTLKLQRLQRVVTVSMQIMKRLYVLSGLDAEKFVEEHMTFGEPAQLMTTAGGSRLIPANAMKTFDALKAHFIRQFPSLFQDGKLLCDTEAYFGNMTQRLLNYEASIELERKTQITAFDPDGNTDRLTKFPRHLDWFYVCYEDFTVHSKNQLLFMSTDRLHLELKMQKESKIHAATRIEPSLLSRREPYVYVYTSKKFKAMFLVQNVEGGEASKAATIASYWVQNRVNLGYFAPPIVPEASANIVLAQSLEIENPFIPLVIKYQSGEHAALLSLNEQ